MKKYYFDDELRSLVEKEEAKCIGCKVCMRGCSMLDEFTSNPKQMLEDLSAQGYFYRDMAYSCMLCGYCEKVCPKGVSLKDIFFKMRKTYVGEHKGNIEKDLGAWGTNFHQDLVFSKVFSDPISGSGSDICFFPGCALVADSPLLVKRVYSYLKDIYPQISLWNTCCGKPTNYLGREDKFRERIESIQDHYRSKGIKKIITACMNCTITFEETCPDLEVIPIYKILAENFPNGASGKFSQDKPRVNVHDPCPARYDDKLLDDARTIIGNLGFEIEELEFSRNKTICCSSGGMVWQTAQPIAAKHKARREAEGDGPLVTYCKECEKRLGENRKTDHLLDLVFLDKEEVFSQHENSLVGSWLNRLRV